MSPKLRSEILPLLGQEQDVALADRFNVSEDVIRRLRRSKGIPPKRRIDPVWMERRPILGTKPDAELAREWGVSRQRVHQVRAIFGIAPFKARPSWGAITPLFGTISDAEIGRRFDIPSATVSSRRIRAGVAAFDPTSHPSYGEEEYQHLLAGKAPPASSCPSHFRKKARRYASRHGLAFPHGAVQDRRRNGKPQRAWELWYREGLGDWSAIADRLGYRNARSASSAAYKYAASNDLPRPSRRHRRPS